MTVGFDFMSKQKGRKKLGELLVASGAVQEEQLRSALGHQRRWGGRLGDILVGMGFVREEGISLALSRQLGVPEVDLTALTIPEAVLAKLPLELCQRHRAIPFAIRRDERGGSFLHVAMADPSDLEAIDDIGFRAGLHVEVAVAPEIEISLAIRRYYHAAIESASPFGDSRKEHYSTGELLRFGEEPLSMDGLDREDDLDESDFDLSDVDLTPTQPFPGEMLFSPPLEPRGVGLYETSDPAFRAVEALVRILTRKGILLEDEFLQEILRDMELPVPNGVKKA